MNVDLHPALPIVYPSGKKERERSATKVRGEGEIGREFGRGREERERREWKEEKSDMTHCMIYEQSQ